MQIQQQSVCEETLESVLKAFSQEAEHDKLADDMMDNQASEVLGEVIDIWKIIEDADEYESESDSDVEPRHKSKSKISWSTINHSKQACEKWLTLHHKHVE